MDDYEDSIKLVYYIVDKFQDYLIYIYFNEYDLKNLKEEMLNNKSFPDEVLHLKSIAPKYAGTNNCLHLYYERKRFYAISADGSSHNFRLGLSVHEPLLSYFHDNYKNFKLMEKNRLESGMQNKVFFIQLMIKDAAKLNLNKPDNS